MMKPKNIVVTGGNSGIGFETVKALYELGHNVIFGSRSAAKNQEAVTEISKQKGGSVVAFALDLSQRKSIEEFVKSVKSKFDHIDILVNNAGLTLGERKISEIGYQMTLTINHFGPFYLTSLLWQNLIRSPQARIINVSSQVSFYASKNYLNDLQCQNGYSQMTQYSNSKLFNVLFTQGLNNLINKNGLKHVKTACLHPGMVETNFGNETCWARFFRCLCCCMVLNQNEGSRTSMYLCNAPLADIRGGQYYNSDTRWKQMDQRGRNAADVQRLWQISEKAYGIRFQ